ncbi:MAG: sialidase family protein [Rhodobacter sp.]|nr:sialidase family protein [Rhodobacter sp.]
MASDRPVSRRTALGGLAAALAAPAVLSAQHFAGYRLVFTEVEVFPDTMPGGLSHFRIPALVSTGSNLLVAFCEGRRHRADHGDTDILVKTSVDGGRTWTRPECQVPDAATCAGGQADRRLHDTIVGTGEDGFRRQANWRNPTVVYAIGRLFLFLVLDEGGETQASILKGRSTYRSRLFVLQSTTPEWSWDERIEWSDPRELTLGHAFRFAQFGPGAAAYNDSRLIVPAATSNGSVADSMSFCMLSDDFGLTWQRSSPAGRATEHQVTRLSDTDLLMSKRAARTQDFWQSRDNGESWTRLGGDPRVVTPLVQTGLATDLIGRPILTGPNHPTDRVDLSMWVRDFDGQWSEPIPIETGLRCRSKQDCQNTQGYSCPAVMADGRVVVLYEDSKHGQPYSRINCAGLVLTL